MEDQVKSLRETLSSAKKIIDEKFESSSKNVQTALETHRAAVSQKTLLDTCNDWVTIVREDTFEKGRKTGYAEACEHLTPILNQSQEMLNQFDDISNKALDSIGNALISATDKVKASSETLSNRSIEVAELRRIIDTLSAQKSDLEKKVQALETKLSSMEIPSEAKPKRGRPKKKKVSDPLV